MPNFMPVPMLLPNRNPSATSAEGQVDYQSIQLYSAIVLAHGATGTASFLTTPKGQAIPELSAGVTATTVADQMKFSDSTTNIVQSGQLGSTIGEVSLTEIGITIQQCGYTVSGASAGAQLTYGAGPQEMSEICFRTSLELKLGSKPQIKGTTFMFPGVGGISGSIANTGNATLVGFLTNGLPGNSRSLDFPLPVERTDTLEGVFGVTAANASLVFSSTSAGGIGQATLVFIALRAIAAADVR